MTFSNYHTHTLFCDGVQPPEDYILKAIKLEMQNIGFSAHAPISIENSWSMKWENLDQYKKTILQLKNTYKTKINIWLSLEIDYIPQITKSFLFFQEKLNMDYIIGAVHLVKPKNINKLWFIDGPSASYEKGLKELFNNDPKIAVNTYYKQINELILTQKFDFIAHLDKIKMNNKNRFFSTSEQWYKKTTEQTINLIANKDIAIEVNTRGIYKKKTNELFPSIELLENIYMKKIPIVLNADAHNPEELTSYFNETILLMKEIGFKGSYHFKDKHWAFKYF